MQQALIEFILNALWQVPLLAGAAWLLVKMAAPGPRVQHLLWLTVLAAALLLPLAGMVTGNRAGPSPQFSAGITATAAAQPSGPPAAGEQPPRWQMSLLPRIVPVRANYGRWLARLYLASLVLGFLRLARAWHQSRRLVAHSRITPHYREALAEVSRRLGVRLPRLRESAEISSPMVVGALNPVLLLPQGFERFTQAEIRAALCHELAHIQRQDVLVNAICQLAALPLIWHPVVDAIEQRIHMTREIICDAMAAAEFESKIGYARCLLTLAHSMLGSPRAAGEAQVLSLFGNHTLEERMMRLTETTTVRVRLQAARIAAGATMMIAAGIVAAMLHVTPTMAQASAAQQPFQNLPAALPRPAAAVSEGNKATPRARAHTAKPRTEPALRLHTGAAQPPAAKMHSLFDDSQFKLQMEDAQKQASNMKAIFDSPQFKQQMEDARRQASMAKALFDSPQFKQQMENAGRQISTAKALIESPQFKKQMEDARRQISTAKALIDSPQFKKQMEEARRQASMAEALVNSPEFKKQIEEARRQASRVPEIFDNPEFKRQMEDMQKDLEQADP